MRRVIYRLRANQTIKEYFLLTNIQTKVGKNGEYLEMTLADASGEIKARKWDITDKDIDLLDDIQNKLPIVVLVKGVTKQFKQALDLKIFYVVLPDNHVGIEEFIPTAPINIEKAMEKLELAINNIGNSNIRSIVREIYTKNKPFLASYPASTHHHRVVGGLIWHLTNTVCLAKHLLELYPKLLHYDLFIAGAILHDIGKINDYTVEQGIFMQVTEKAKMVGHIVETAHEIRAASNKHGIDYNAPEIQLLEHIVLSHHGKGEYGSPVQPVIPEAIALHLIDVLDTKLGAIYHIIENTDEGSWSNWSPLLDARIKKIKLS